MLCPSVGRYILAFYLGTTSTASVYGAAGSFVLLLLWVFYSAQLILLGAEFTQIYARRYGSQIVRAGKKQSQEQPAASAT